MNPQGILLALRSLPLDFPLLSSSMYDKKKDQFNFF